MPLRQHWVIFVHHDFHSFCQSLKIPLLRRYFYHKKGIIPVAGSLKSTGTLSYVSSKSLRWNRAVTECPDIASSLFHWTQQLSHYYSECIVIDYSVQEFVDSFFELLQSSLWDVGIKGWLERINLKMIVEWLGAIRPLEVELQEVWIRKGYPSIGSFCPFTELDAVSRPHRQCGSAEVCCSA